ncbi:hypothetical protein LSUE1_G002097 [Lachnellula suecica]|uniref:Uncharacterized protein n=1 Tax=Lachnellula suecica TaxID=602035 RepID=A0A8T9CI35_9HELO|nr:hypothetical protein LSUE1_G002097 [Lachnellula suecica]
MSDMRWRTSALFPFVLSTVSFVLITLLVVSGTNPDLVPDGYLLSFNTTSVGQNLVQFSPITAPAIASRSTTPESSAADNTTVSVSTAPNLNASMASVATSNSSSSSSAAPILSVPQVAGPANPAAIPITLISGFFQLTLNTFASGMGDTLQNIVKLLVTTTKQSAGVSQYYTMHLTGVCQGSVVNASATNESAPFNLTRCTSYEEAGTYIANITQNVTASTLVAATNITVPALAKVPGIGKSSKSLIDLAARVILAVFVISLIGNGVSILLSVAAFFAPYYGILHTAGAAITTISTQLLQIAAMTSTGIAISISSTMNSFSDTSGLSATIGGKFLALIWFGYIAAQMANGYWMTTWFVTFRKSSYKARWRTQQEMGDYKGIKKEILSDLRLPKAESDDTERLTGGPTEITHWDDSYKKM